MRTLHLFSNWKWTGPAEPAVRLAAALAGRHQVDFAGGRCPYPDLENRVESEAIAAGLNVLPGFTLSKHFRPIGALRDVRRATRVIREGGHRVVHAHMLNDHLIGGIAARRAGSSSGSRPLLVRTVYGAGDVRRDLRGRIAFERYADAVIFASHAAAARGGDRLGVPADRRFVVPGAVDVDRFAPERLSPLRAAARAELGLADDDVVAGIVARVQRHRRFELLLAAFARAAAASPRLRLAIIGRGTHIDEVVREPVRRLGLDDKVQMVGYRGGRDYEAMLAALDLGIYLVPGSDGSCRAARELCAASLPLLVSDRDPLPEIVDDGVNGRVVSESEEDLAAAWVELGADDARRRAMGAASRDRAEHFFSLRDQADEVEEIYCRLLEMGPRRTGGSEPGIDPNGDVVRRQAAAPERDPR